MWSKGKTWTLKWKPYVTYGMWESDFPKVRSVKLIGTTRSLSHNRPLSLNTVQFDQSLLLLTDNFEPFDLQIQDYIPDLFIFCNSFFEFFYFGFICFSFFKMSFGHFLNFCISFFVSLFDKCFVHFLESQVNPLVYFYSGG